MLKPSLASKEREEKADESKEYIQVGWKNSMKKKHKGWKKQMEVGKLRI